MNSLTIKLASIAVHAEEMLSADGHAFDRAAIEGLLRDPEIRALLDAPEHRVFLPVKRSAPPSTAYDRMREGDAVRASEFAASSIQLEHDDVLVTFKKPSPTCTVCCKPVRPLRGEVRMTHKKCLP